MKKFLYCALMFGAVMGFTACEDDNDDNPIITKPSEFKVNDPTFANQKIDLATSGELTFTYSQPNWSFPLVVNYTLQYSLDGNFNVTVDEAEADETGTLKADYQVSLSSSGSSITIEAADIAKGLQQIGQWESDAVPGEATLYYRIKAIPAQYSITDTKDVEKYAIYSEVKTLTVVPTYVELSAAEIDIWYLIGGDICDGKWGSDVGVSIWPMMTVKDYEYDKKTGAGEISFTGYFGANGFKLKHTTDSWDEQWGQGDAFGTFVENDGGSSNITVPAAGFYKVVLNTMDHKLTVEAADITPAKYDKMCLSGDFNDWGDTEMTAACTYEGAENHLWYATLTVDGSQGVKFKIADSWDTNWGAADFPRGWGAQNGENIYPEAGTYLVLFNDIDGSYQFIAQ